MADEQPRFTGRQIIVFADEVQGDAVAMTEALQSTTGATSIASSLDYASGAVDVEQAAAAAATLFAELGIAVLPEGVASAPSITAAMTAEARIIAIEPERVLYAIDDVGASGGAIADTPSGSLEYLRGYRDAAAHIYQRWSAAQIADIEADLGGAADTAALTWGLQVTGAGASSRAGTDIKVAVLDTGLDMNHPDFTGRAITAESFISGETAQDGNGHGTHCAGTSCGAAPASGCRYGVADGAVLFVGKVLNNAGRGGDGNVLAGINWALANRVQVISMSLGVNLRPVSTAYETVGRRALAAGTLIVAAAGNNASRGSGNGGFVGVPANSPSIMAVAAVDAQMKIADFSATSNPIAGGQVDIAAPGVSVYSSWPMPKRYNSISGTSMATPHVAGLAALFAQATGATGAKLWSAVTQAARRLSLSSADVGVGLAQAPR